MFDTDPFDMSELERHKFAILGRFDTFMTIYKHDVEDFIVAVRKHSPKFEAKKKLKTVLKSQRKRTEFVRDAFEHLPELQEVKIPGLAFDREKLVEDMLAVNALRDTLAEAEIVGLRRANGKTMFQVRNRNIETRARKVEVHVETSACDTAVLGDVIGRARSISNWLGAAKAKLASAPPAGQDAVHEHHMA